MIDIRRWAKSNYLVLVPILALAFYMAFIPHQGYAYLVHLDEWMHLAASNAILKAESVTFISPYAGQGTISPSSNLEVGFHLFWAVFRSISGISWLIIFKYFTGIIFIITILSVYIMAQREGFGWEAALFACLIPTTIGLLGPGFLVPVATGLLFIPLALFIAFNFRTIKAYVVLFLLASLLLLLHAPTAIGLVIILAPYVLLNLKSDLQHSVKIIVSMAIPFILVLFFTFRFVLDAVIKPLFIHQLPLQFVNLPSIIQTYGYLPILLCLLGILLLAIKGGKNNYGLILGLLTFLIVQVTFFTFHYGSIYIYYRGWMPTMLILSVIAGAGLMGVKHFKLPASLGARLKAPLVTQNVGKFLCLVLIGVTLAIAIPDRHEISYYHMIDQKDYQAFIWIKGNVGEDYQRAVLEPWKGSAFTALTGKEVHSYIGEYPKESDLEATDFLNGGCENTTFLRENGVSIVYTRGSCNNPDLVELRKYVYLLKEAENQ